MGVIMNRYKIFVLLISLTLFTCAEEKQLPPSKSAVDRALEERAQQNVKLRQNAAQKLAKFGVTMKPIPKLPKVNPQGMMLRNFTAGLKQLQWGTVVTLSYDRDPQSDYLQIKRCDSSIEVNGLLNKPLGKVETKDVEKLADIFQDYDNGNKQAFEKDNGGDINNYWRSASISGCEILSNMVVEEQFYDVLAKPDHEYYYIARVCVNDDRVTKVEGKMNPSSCSDTVKLSNKIQYVDMLIGKEREYKMRFQRARNKMNKFIAIVHEAAIKLAEAWDICETRNIKHRVAKERREGYALIGGMAIGAVASFAGGFMGGGSAVGGFNNVMGSMEFGTQIGSAIADIMAKPEDFETTCTEAEKWNKRLEPYRDSYNQIKEELENVKKDLDSLNNMKESVEEQKEDLGDTQDDSEKEALKEEQQKQAAAKEEQAGE